MGIASLREKAYAHRDPWRAPRPLAEPGGAERPPSRGRLVHA